MVAAQGGNPGLLAFIIFGPLLNLLLWTVAERWYFPRILPLDYGIGVWARVFSPRDNAMDSLRNSVLVAVLTVMVSLALPYRRLRAGAIEIAVARPDPAGLPHSAGIPTCPSTSISPGCSTR